MAYCESCSQLLEDNSIFCSNCGTRIINEENSTKSSNNESFIEDDNLEYNGSLEQLKDLMADIEKEEKIERRKNLFLKIWKILGIIVPIVLLLLFMIFDEKIFSDENFTKVANWVDKIINK